MNILLVYGSTEGQTRKIAEFCADHLTKAGIRSICATAAGACWTWISRSSTR